MSRAADAVRRGIDLAAASAGLILLCPVLAAIALAIRVRLGRGVLYRQRRLGRGGHPFVLYKFRTMAHPKPGREGPEFDAERLTRLGRLLRATSLDELPSLVNLLRGDLTLVGPRPLPVHYWPRFRDEEYRRFEVRPGLTGLAQIHGRNTVDWDRRLAYDVQYVACRSLLGDLRILLRTIPAVLSGAGVDQAGGVTMSELPPSRPASSVSRPE